MSIDGSGSREMRANSSDEDALFTLWFHLINLCLPGAGVCGDNQGIADKEKTENTGIGGADKPSTGGADVEKDSSIGRADAKKGLGTGEADKLSKGGTNVEEDLGTGGADAKEGPGTGGADKAERQLARRRAAARASLFSFCKVLFFFLFFGIVDLWLVVLLFLIFIFILDYLRKAR